MQKASNVKLESSSVKYAINLATSHQYASKKAKANTPLIPFMQGNQKHNNYVQGHFTPSKDAGSSEYDSDPQEKFCLQMKVHRTCISHPEVPKLVYLNGQLSIPSSKVPHQKPISMGQTGHLCRCEFNAYGSVLPDV